MTEQSRVGTGTGVAFSAYDLLPDAVVVVGPDGRVLYLNDLARRLLDMERGADAVGRPAAELVPLLDEGGEDWWGTDQPLADDASVRHRIPERELMLRTPTRERPVTMAAARWRSDGGHGLLLVLRRAERRQRLDAARSELVATVSHELRSPLTAVKGFTKTLLAKWDRFTDEQKKQMLATVNADADRVTRLLGELLDVSRIDAGRLGLRRRRVSLEDVAQRVAERAGAASPGRVIDVAVPAGIPYLYADEDKIEQVLTNLVENAFMHGKGPVRISAERVGDDHVRLTVADEGGRIAREHLRHLFTKFYRGGAERRSGTGLGLYITKGIIEAHGGRVWAESEPDRGTRFHALLPFGQLPTISTSEHAASSGVDGVA